MKTNRYEKKIKKIRREKRERRKAYRWISRIFGLIVGLAFVGFTLAILVKNPGLLFGYAVDLHFTLFGLLGFLVLLEQIFSQEKSIKVLGISVLFTIVGVMSLSTSWNLTLDIPKYVLFDAYETKSVRVESLNYRKYETILITPDETYAFHSSSKAIPDADILEIDFLPKSKIVLDARAVE